MSTGFEQRLRAEMEQVAVRPRPGLVNEAYCSYRGKRRMIRAVAATGTAMAIAAGTAVGVAAATASPAAIPAQTTAYVVSHVSSALATTNRDYVHDHDHELRPAGKHPARHPDVWDYGTRGRQLDESASGQPMWESWVQTGHGKPTSIWVDYQQRSWERFAIRPGRAATAAVPLPSTRSAPHRAECHAGGLEAGHRVRIAVRPSSTWSATSGSMASTRSSSPAAPDSGTHALGQLGWRHHSLARPAT